MIKRLKIKNFRARKKDDIKFSPGVNCIIGNNAAGKSTILRAIKYAATNKPSGDSVINWDAKKTIVKLFYENNKITRIRGKSINKYKLNDKEFTAFGSNVPEEIQKVLGLSDINFQGQHDAPFWFCKTPGEVSRQLNAIVNLDIIDKTLSNISSGITKRNMFITMIKQRMQKVADQKKDLLYVKTMHADLCHIESLQKDKEKNACKRDSLEQLVRSGRLYANEADLLKARLSGAVLVLDMGLARRNIRKKAKSLSVQVISAIELQKIIDKAPPAFDHITKLNNDRCNCGTDQMILEDIISNIKHYKEKLWPQKRKVKQNQIELKRMVKRKCPLCGNSP
jgi:DNA repair exonuclease SbcCD ATPase subunit